MGDTKYQRALATSLREAFKKKNSKKSDIVTIRSGTYLPYLNSDIKFSEHWSIWYIFQLDF